MTRRNGQQIEWSITDDEIDVSHVSKKSWWMEISGKTLSEVELYLSIVGRGVLARDTMSTDQD
jgi:hypothetical protein